MDVCLVSPTRGKSCQRLAGRIEARVNLEDAREVWVNSAQDRHAVEDNGRAGSSRIQEHSSESVGDDEPF